jgi:hypothetical protein
MSLSQVRTDDADAELASTVHLLKDDYETFLIDAGPAICQDFPEFKDVPNFIEAHRQIVRAHARTIAEPLGPSPLDDLDQLAEGATGFVRHCAQWGIPATTGIRILHRVFELSWVWWTEHIAKVVDDPQLQAYMTLRATERLIEYLRGGSYLVTVIYETEQDACIWGGSWRGRRSVMEVLAGRKPVNLRQLSLEVGHEFDAWQVGFVAWSDGDDNEAPQQAAIRAWVRDAAESTPLLIAGDGEVIWGWTSSGEWPEWTTKPLPAPPPNVGIALGQPGVGVVGFRNTHDEAMQARELGSQMKHQARLVRHSDIAPLTLLAVDADRLRRFVSCVLGELAKDNVRARYLRETVRCYLAEGDNVRVVAAKMQLHRNTVRGRLELAAQLRGRGLDHDRLSLMLALEIVDSFPHMTLVV